MRYLPTIEEAIERLKAVKAADLRKFHKDFYGASNAQMTVIGDFDAAQVEQTIRKTLGAWKSPRPFERVAGKHHGGIEGHLEKILTPDKKMAMVAGGLNVKMRDDDPRYPAMHFANYVLGGSAKSRLLERLRQKEGLSYGTGSFFVAASQDERALFAGMAICAPENAAQAHDSLVDEFRRLVKEGIPAAELEDAKASYALQVKNRLANDTMVAGMLNSGLYLDRGMDWWQGLYDAIAGLTPEQLKQTLAASVDLDGMVRVQAGDLPAEAAAASGTADSGE